MPRAFASSLLLGALVCGAAACAGTAPTATTAPTPTPDAIRALEPERVPIPVRNATRDAHAADRASMVLTALTDDGARRYWIFRAFSPFDVARGAALEAGALDAFDARFDAEVEACERAFWAASTCEDYCESGCTDEVVASIGDPRPTLIATLVDERAGAVRTVAERTLWTGRPFEDPELRFIDARDVDQDTRLELMIELRFGMDWPAGDGGDRERRLVILDSETFGTQAALRIHREEDGHAGGSEMRSAWEFADVDEDGHPDLTVQVVYEPFYRECAGEDAGDEPMCLPFDRSFTALYQPAADVWRLPAGDSWPW